MTANSILAQFVQIGLEEVLCVVQRLGHSHLISGFRQPFHAPPRAGIFSASAIMVPIHALLPAALCLKSKGKRVIHANNFPEMKSCLTVAIATAARPHNSMTDGKSAEDC